MERESTCCYVAYKVQRVDMCTVGSRGMSYCTKLPFVLLKGTVKSAGGSGLSFRIFGLNLLRFFVFEISEAITWARVCRIPHPNWMEFRKFRRIVEL